MRITGAGGALRVGYQTAARLGAWTLTQNRTQYELRAEVADIDTFWYPQRPMSVSLQMGSRRWEWAHVDPTREHPITVALQGAPRIT